MANQAQKKRDAKADTMSKALLIALVVVHAIYIFFRYGEEFSNWQWAGVVLHTLVSGLTYSSIVSSERQGHTYEYYFDLFAINVVVQLGSIYSENFWYLFLVVPAFVLYKAGRMVLNYVFTPDPEDGPMDAAALKKQQKMERKQKRMRM